MRNKWVMSGACFGLVELLKVMVSRFAEVYYPRPQHGQK